MTLSVTLTSEQSVVSTTNLALPTSRPTMTLRIPHRQTRIQTRSPTTVLQGPLGGWGARVEDGHTSTTMTDAHKIAGAMRARASRRIVGGSAGSPARMLTRRCQKTRSRPPPRRNGCAHGAAAGFGLTRTEYGFLSFCALCFGKEFWPVQSTRLYEDCVIAWHWAMDLDVSKIRMLDCRRITALSNKYCTCQ